MGELLRKTVGRIIEAEAKKEDSELQMYSQEPSGAMGEMEPGDVPVDELPPEEEPAGDAERVAQEFHETYERLAPEHGYDTRDASKGTWDEVPEENRNLMTAVVSDLLERGVIASGEGEAEPEIPLEEPSLPETDDGDPWVPLEAVEGFCGECAREMMSRNIKAVRLSVLTEAGLVEQAEVTEKKVVEQGGPIQEPIRVSTETFHRLAYDERMPSFEELGDGLEGLSDQGNKLFPVTDGQDVVFVDPQGYEYARYRTPPIDVGVVDDLSQEEVSQLLRRKAEFQSGFRLATAEEARRFMQGTVAGLRTRAPSGREEPVTEKKAAKNSWPKKLKAGRFTEWCKRNGFKGGASVTGVREAMRAGDASVRACAEFFANTIKPEGKNLSDIIGKGKK